MSAASPALPSIWPAAAAAGAAGAGLAILVNRNAKRGGRRVAAQIARTLPGASVRLTRTEGEIDAWLARLANAPSTRGIFAAGGDGTVVALVNALARSTPPDQELPTAGILPLGTGNGWAHALGAPKLHRCLALLAAASGPLPTRRCSLVEVEGTLAHFAGSGWDAMILDDYRRQVEQSRGPGRTLSKTMYGYVSAALLRTTPKVALYGNPHVAVENLGPVVYTVDRDGKPREARELGPGAVLYDGPVGTASVGTCPEFGYRFKAFPFAERIPGFMNVRVYAREALHAVTSIPRLWSGAYPLDGMHDWLATHVRMTFSRPVPLQVGGDAHGMRRSIEYRTAARGIRMVDWRRISS
jgi:diacylglycerol kinase family enzyme